jgi:hypothetical protein
MFDRFNTILGAGVERSTTLDFNVRNVPTMDLIGLDFCFSEQEIWQVIRVMPLDKAPSPYGCIGLFYQSSWPIIKSDIMQAIHAF